MNQSIDLRLKLLRFDSRVSVAVNGYWCAALMAQASSPHNYLDGQLVPARLFVRRTGAVSQYL